MDARQEGTAAAQSSEHFLPPLPPNAPHPLVLISDRWVTRNVLGCEAALYKGHHGQERFDALATHVISDRKLVESVVVFKFKDADNL